MNIYCLISWECLTIVNIIQIHDNFKIFSFFLLQLKSRIIYYNYIPQLLLHYKSINFIKSDFQLQSECIKCFISMIESEYNKQQMKEKTGKINVNVHFKF